MLYYHLWSIVRYILKKWVIRVPSLPLYPLIPIGLDKRWNLRLKKVAISIARRVLINTKPFAPESVREETLTKYLLQDKLQGIVKYGPLINWSRSISIRLIPSLPKKESFPRHPRFPVYYPYQPLQAHRPPPVP
jgi:hypothetical protein